MDTVTPEKRSEVMRCVRSKDTKPEVNARKYLHAQGFRFRLYQKHLPGKPDIVLPKYRVCIFVHGCFWHQHGGCRQAMRPSSNTDYWRAKLDGNMRRDAKHAAELAELGWRVVILWECEIRTPDRLKATLDRLTASFAQGAAPKPSAPR